MTRKSPAVQSAVPATVIVTLIGWSALGLAVVLGGASVTMAAADLQYAFLTLTSVLAFLVPLGAISLGRRSAANSARTAGQVSAPADRLVREQGGAMDLLSIRNGGVSGPKAIESSGRAHASQPSARIALSGTTNVKRSETS